MKLSDVVRRIVLAVGGALAAGAFAGAFRFRGLRFGEGEEACFAIGVGLVLFGLPRPGRQGEADT